MKLASQLALYSSQMLALNTCWPKGKNSRPLPVRPASKKKLVRPAQFSILFQSEVLCAIPWWEYSCTVQLLRCILLPLVTASIHTPFLAFKDAVRIHGPSHASGRACICPAGRSKSQHWSWSLRSSTIFSSPTCRSCFL